MPCYHPLNAYRYPGPGKSSKITFLKSGVSIPTKAEYLRLPCGQCIGCRLDRSRHWATRCMHEARMHDHNCFITLTYDEANLPPCGSLHLSHWQNFMKRLRHHAKKQGAEKPLKFLHSAEYGDQYKRPHYHACIFGYDFPDKSLFQMRNDIPLYTSDQLTRLWGKGYASLGEVTWNSAAYCARYCVKKINGARRQIPDPKTGLLPYERVHLYSAEIVEVLPEYSTQSRNPGLGQTFFNEFADDIFPWDECIVNGHPTRPPRYYDNLYKLSEPDEFEAVQARRIKLMESFIEDNTRARLSDKEKVKIAQTSNLKRDLPDEI